MTGAAAGIGRAIADELARAGARVALLDLDGEAAERAAAALRRDGHDAIGLACDVRDEDACAEAIARVERRFGGVDVLVNNAGISHRSLFADTDPGVVRRVMDVNFFGAVAMTRAALPSLTARRGRIVVLSSVAGFAPLVARSVYSASKHALHGFFDTLRTELDEHGVSVLVVCPTFTRTRIDERALSGGGEAMGSTRRTVTGRLLEPAEVARQTVAAAADRRRMLIVGRVGHASWLISRVAPALYDRLMLRTQADEIGGP